MEAMRLNKYLAQYEWSRREADELIERGLVAVNGRVAEPGMKVTGEETILVEGRELAPVAQHVVVAWYKPLGVTTTKNDPHATVTVSDVFHYPVPLTYAGRLDRDSEGLLLMTNDGDLINALMRGSAGHEKEYVVRTRGRISDAALHQMEKGLWLKDLEVRTKPCRVERLSEYTFRIVLTQGLNRQIRRMCRAVGSEVKSLKRVRVENITIKGLKPGAYRELTGEETGELYARVGLGR